MLDFHAAKQFMQVVLDNLFQRHVVIRLFQRHPPPLTGRHFDAGKMFGAARGMT